MKNFAEGLSRRVISHIKNGGRFGATLPSTFANRLRALLFLPGKEKMHGTKKDSPQTQFNRPIRALRDMARTSLCAAGGTIPSAYRDGM
jgi:hypothetical protein